MKYREGPYLFARFYSNIIRWSGILYSKYRGLTLNVSFDVY